MAEVLINPIRDREGGLVGFAKITRDITRRKQAERDLEQARAALAQSQKMEAVGQLTGGIAHDFNNMLTAILGSLELLEIRQEAFSQGANRMLQVIRQAAEHGAELTRRLLAFSRKQTLAPALTGHQSAGHRHVGTIATHVGRGYQGRNHHGGGSCGPRLSIPIRLRARCSTLAVNARDAMQQGGKLTIETGNALIDGRLCSHACRCRRRASMFSLL